MTALGTAMIDAPLAGAIGPGPMAIGGMGGMGVGDFSGGEIAG